MGDALDDYYDRLDSMDTVCPVHQCLYASSEGDCPKCDAEYWERITERDQVRPSP